MDSKSTALVDNGPADIGALKGVIIRAYGSRFIAKTERGDISCVVRVNLKRASLADTPVVVGDDAHITLISETDGVIESIGPRRTAFFRQERNRADRKQTLAANIDQLVIISSCFEPPLKPRFIDRFTVAGDIGGLKPVVLLNKSDLGTPDLVQELLDGYQLIGIPAMTTSALNGDGVERLKSILVGKKSLFVGHSGVGKSTLLNALLPGLNLKTAEISEYSNRGKHTTTRVELHEFPTGGFVLDSPGLKVLSLWEVDRKSLASHFEEFRRYSPNCRFNDCSHITEPNCAVMEAIENGEIPLFRHQSYQHIRETLPN